MPVELDQSTQSSTDLATHQQYGCSIDGRFYAEGAQVNSINSIPNNLFLYKLKFIYSRFEKGNSYMNTEQVIVVCFRL